MALKHAVRCDAHSKGSGQQCKNPAVLGSKKCRHHGGLTPAGKASVHFKHGRYSKCLPTNLLGKFEQACGDKELVELKREIALLDVFTGELLEELGNAATTRAKEIRQEIPNLIERRRRLVMSETAREKLVESFVPVEEVLLMMSLLVDTIKTELGDSPKGRHLLQKLNLQTKAYLGDTY